MPMFVKMGLNGTGYLGLQGKELVRRINYSARRKVLPGFPVDEPFQSKEAVLEYLDHDKITCLCCGKQFSKLAGPHLQKIHGLTDDQYKEKYHIPYTYALAGKDVRLRHSQNLINDIKSGVFHATGNPSNVLLKPERRKTFYKREQLAKNMADITKFDRAKRPLVVAEDGTKETYSDNKKRLRAKKGTPEYFAKLANRPQNRNPPFNKA